MARIKEQNFPFCFGINGGLFRAFAERTGDAGES
jgi:hypothetical protein